MMTVAAIVFYGLFGGGFAAACDWEIRKRDPEWSGGLRFTGVVACFLLWPFLLGTMVASFFAQAIEP
jgi:hypothetical protein